MTIRPRRSVLYMPGSNARAMEKARELPADAVILDLEDAVAPDAKATARELIIQALKKGGFGNREVLVRINGLDTAWWLDDLAVAAAGPDAVLVPKVSTPKAASPGGKASRRGERRSARSDLGDDGDAARHAQCTRHCGLRARAANPAYGLRHGHQRSCQGHPRPDRAGPGADVALADELRGGGARLRPRYSRRRLQRTRQCRRLRCGMPAGARAWLRRQDPYPSEPDRALQPAFSPTDDEVAWARKIIAAFALPENRNKGVIQVDGRMVEILHADMARRTVAIADAIAQTPSA